jgi:ABC-type lipoprotein release transport system permease subunit
MLPLRYALRNLARRPLRTALTLVGLGAIAFLVVLTTGFATGLDRSVRNSGRDDVAIVVGASGETDLVRSFLSMGAARQVADGVGGVLEVDGQRAASIELHTMSRVGDHVGLLRGVTPAAYRVRPSVVAIDGREPRAPFELFVGRLAWARMGLPEADLATGRTVHLEGRDWSIAGRFAAPGTVLEAEMWGRLDDVMAATGRVDVSCVALRLRDAASFGRVKLFAMEHTKLEISAMREAELFEAFRRTLAPVALLARVMALLVLIGGVFGCANTMLAAVLARTREMGALRAVGYGPLAVGVSLLEESLLLGALGGIVGFVAASLVAEIPLRFPAGAFVLDLSLAARVTGLLSALGAGLLGGLFPAWRAIRQPLPDALGGRL